MFSEQRQLAELRRLYAAKRRSAEAPAALGGEMVEFFRRSVEKRQTKLARIAECWAVLVPEPLLEHTALESLHRGSLTVLVDSSPHLYDLKQLLLAGLQQQLLLACRSTGLRKIILKPGRWYDEREAQDQRARFD